MKAYRRTKTREGFEDCPQWRKGYSFDGEEFPDEGVVREVGAGFVHLRENLEETRK